MHSSRSTLSTLFLHLPTLLAKTKTHDMTATTTSTTQAHKERHRLPSSVSLNAITKWKCVAKRIFNLKDEEKKKRSGSSEQRITFFCVLSHLQIHIPNIVHCLCSCLFLFFAHRCHCVPGSALHSFRNFYRITFANRCEHTCDTESHLPYSSIDVAYTIREIRTNTGAFVSVKTACRMYTLHTHAHPNSPSFSAR